MDRNIEHYDWNEEFYKKEKKLKERFKLTDMMSFYFDYVPENVLGEYRSFKKAEELADADVKVYTKIKGVFPIIQMRIPDKRKYSLQYWSENQWSKLKADDDEMTERFEEFIRQPQMLIKPATFWGTQKTTNSVMEDCFAIVIDVDYVTSECLDNVFVQIESGHVLKPNYLVNSGKGLHFYYFIEPICVNGCYKGRMEPHGAFWQLKEALQHQCWNEASSLDDKRDAVNLNQGFRPVGSIAKNGEEIKAYRVLPERICKTKRYTVKEIIEFFQHTDLGAKLPKDFDIDTNTELLKKELIKQKRQENRDRIERATNIQLYGKEQPKEKRVAKAKTDISLQYGYATYNPKVYEWWFNKIKDGTPISHRYWCIYMLAVFAIKYNVPSERVIEDATSLMEKYQTIGTDPFTDYDLACALSILKCRKDARVYLYLHTPRLFIQEYSGINIPPQKRNYMPRNYHLKKAREVQEILNPEWRKDNGRKPKEQVIREWQQANPGRTKAECIRETGLSKPTVYKWWR